MSRFATKPISVPKGVTLIFNDTVCTVRGPKGEMTRPVPGGIASSFDAKKSEILVTPIKHTRRTPALAGTWYAHMQNMIKGVVEGFSKVLVFEGVGYRAAREGTDLVLSLGFSHPVRFPIPATTDVVVEKNTIRVTGINKEIVGQVAANIRALKVPEPYKGKGIRYQDEVIRRKAGKKAGVGSK